MFFIAYTPAGAFGNAGEKLSAGSPAEETRQFEDTITC
jgi:hypothetical protein